MDEQSVDRRVRKTKKQLRQGLTQLMASKSIKEITVKELTDLVDMNRSTFYSHYRDIADLLNRIEQEMLTQFVEVVNKNMDRLSTEPLSLLLGVFEFLAEYSDMCTALMSKNGDIAFVDKLKAILKEKCLHSWTQIYQGTDARLFEHYFAFIVSGCIGLFQNWLETGMTESPREMAALAERMIMEGFIVPKI